MNWQKELFYKVLTAIIWLPLIYITLYYGYMEYLILFLAIVLYSEMLIAVNSSSVNWPKKALVFIGGCFYLVYGIFALSEIVQLADGVVWNFLLSIFAIDTTAYLAGNLLKGPKLLPKVSPNKHISGFLAANITAYYCAHYFMGLNLFFGILFGVLVQIGDLLVSYAKRILKIKDASNLLPGHGGFWDRCDSLLFGALFLYYLILIGIM